ncbi:MAG: DNA repair protein RecN [Chitinophagaceae bacterium]|nr:DNA repair protein RecN [Chitinophagaceae bacterium]
MLKTLSIRNYAIIEKLEITFSHDMNAITGETGAGKSIIMGALGLILGNRADSNVLLNKGIKCIIEGVFIPNKKISIDHFLHDNELDGGEELLIRREISPQGKSRAFINDTPVTLAQLQKLSSLLVDLHQQFDTLSLAESGFQRQVVDVLAGQSSALSEFATIYSELQEIKGQMEKLKNEKKQFEKDADYNRFLLNELEIADFKENELENLHLEITSMSNAEGIRTALENSGYLLTGNEEPIVQQLKKVLNQLQSFSEFNQTLPGLIQRLQSAQIEIDDIASDLENLAGNINFDAGRVEEINDRISMGYKLQKKHGVQSTNELLQIQQELTDKLQAVLNVDEIIQLKEKKAADLLEKATAIAVKISNARKKQITPLQDAVNILLKRVGMPNARLKVTVQPVSLNQYGVDAVEFLFDANISDENGSKNYLPLRKVASGGELSRLMLCIKSLVASSIDLPTLIFDEIDTGISGEAARQVGLIMKELSVKRQLICITHQPQIAGKASAHFFVYKSIHKQSITTGVRLLTTEERIETIAKMLGGEKPTAAALENAREMVML